MLRKQLQEKESTQGQIEGNALSPRRDATQVQGQRKEQTGQPLEFKEPPSFHDMPTCHNTAKPQGETNADINSARPALH